jgi:hypothetical protein
MKTRTNAQRQSDYRGNKLARDFSFKYLGGRLDVSLIEFVTAKESQAKDDYGFESVTFAVIVTEYFFNEAIYLELSQVGVYQVKDMLLLWDEALKSLRS